MGPAPGRFELSKVMLKWKLANVLGLETFNCKIMQVEITRTDRTDQERADLRSPSSPRVADNCSSTSYGVLLEIGLANKYVIFECWFIVRSVVGGNLNVDRGKL
jgi:hypothetical protein